jgi:acetyl coenzyme A synthetase (ADP forming)-like protein
VAYPEEYEFDVALRDGGTVHLRPIRPDDAGRLVAFFEHLGPRSRYFRFFRLKERLEPVEVAYFTTVDYQKRMALIALQGDDLVAVGRYDQLEQEPGVAEVAFAVADDHQGRGVGTALLQLLTTYARTHQVESFRALVLAENAQMMRVFRNSGYSLKRTLEEGVYTVEFPVADTGDARAAAAEREQRAVAASLLPLFFPRSVAVIGASTTPGSIGNRLFTNLLREGFTGPLYPVNRTSHVVNSVRAYPSILDIADPVDLAFVVVPGDQVTGVVEECAKKGTRGVVVISAGFSEVGEAGEAREQELLEVVRRAGMRMVGPNCMGLLNTASASRLNGTFAPIYPPAGNVAMSSQSGALGIAILDYAARSGIGISQFVSVGNGADVDGTDLLLSWEEDPNTDVILLYMESFGNPRRFSRLARRIARRKPIVAVKSGRSTAGSRAATSHTGSLAGSDVAADALFAQAGVIRTRTIEEQFAVAGLLATQPVPMGRRVGIITNAGGPAILAADALEAGGLLVPELSSELRAELVGELPQEASTRNPVDLIAGAGPAEYRRTLRKLLVSEEVDAVMLIYVPTTPEGAAEVARAVQEVMDEYDGPISLLGVLMQTEGAGTLMRGSRRSMPTYLFPEAAALALSRAVQYGEWCRRDPGEVPLFDDFDLEAARQVVGEALVEMGAGGGWLSPTQVASVLKAFGIDAVASETVQSKEEAVAAALRIGGPVAVKVVAPSALHKSDVGGVALDVEGSDEVQSAFRRVWSAVPDPRAVVVQEMVHDGHEVLIGMTQDPSFGPLIGFGLGGVLVELLEDVTFRVHPLTNVDARVMVRSIKGARLLTGYRNHPPGDIEAVEQLLLRVSGLVSAITEVEEIDLNPVKVLPPGHGARVVDARIRVAPVAPGQVPELADLPSVLARGG